MPWDFPRGLSRWRVAVLSVTALAAPLALASERVQEVYVVRGAHGEVSFSDEPRPGAQRIAVTVREPSDEVVLAAERRVEQTLRVAKALEESRLARERVRAERAAARQPDTPVIQQILPAPQVAYLIGRPLYRPGYPWHPDRDQGAQPPALPSQPVLRAPMLPRAPWRPDGGSSGLHPAAEG